jgi:hypothetical protein
VPLRHLFNRFTAIALLGVLTGTAASFFTGRAIGYNQGADRRQRLPNGAILCKSGPWGDLSYTPFTIAPPDDLLPVRTIETAGTHWFLKGYTADGFVTLLQSTSLTPDQQRQLLDPAVLHPKPSGIDLTPSPDLVFSLPPDARAKIYQIMAQSVLDNTAINLISRDSEAERFAASGVSPATIALFHQLCAQRGNYLIFSSQAAIFARIPSYDEKLRFLRALTRQRTLVLNLHITPQSDVDALARYWGVGCYATDVRTILQSLTTITPGTYMNIQMVLPNLPSSEVYDYPNVLDNPLDGPPVNRDCHWTSLNFFRDVPNPNFGIEQYVRQELNDNYHPITSAPRYGDVLLFAKPDGTIIHSAVYLADDICFTKNGGAASEPWMISTLSDILDQYSILINPDQKLTISYYRNKQL